MLIAAGRAIVSKTGGASGPLYGTVLRRAGKALGDAEDVDAAALGTALKAALDGAQDLGKAAEGDKTMIDALAPAVAAYEAALADGADLAAACAPPPTPPRRAPTTPCRCRRTRGGRATWGAQRRAHGPGRIVHRARAARARRRHGGGLTWSGSCSSRTAGRSPRAPPRSPARWASARPSSRPPGRPEGRLGTSIDLVEQAVAAANEGDGVVLLADLGSSVLTAKMLIEDADGDDVLLADAPLVEGAVAAASMAATGADLATVHAAAESARDHRKT